MKSFDIFDNCTMVQLSDDVYKHCENFSCGDVDLDDFFINDAQKYADEMIGKTYCWISNTKPYTITAFFTISNDSIKTISLSSSSKNRLNRTLPNAKRGRSYPAVLIGRVGVNTEFRGLNIGTQLIQFIKDWFCAKDNKTGCRFLIVDAYNQESVLAFYKRNGFKYLYADEEEEKIYYNTAPNESMQTRLMYFDLKTNI